MRKHSAYYIKNRLLSADVLLNQRSGIDTFERRFSFMTNTIKTIGTSGKAFVDSSGTRFMVRGVTLSVTTGVDLLSEDYHDYMQTYVIPRLNYLNVNVVRVYSVEESASHSKVMELLAENNIYAMVSLVSPQVSVNRLKPYYSLALYNRLTTIAAEFCGFANTFAFEVGNEVVFPGNIYANLNNDAEKANQTIKADAAVMKSMVSDLKAYIAANNLRAVPVGMAMQDGPTNTLAAWGGIGTDIVAEYYACGNSSQSADFIGINSYRYIPGNPMTSYDGLADEVKTIPVPVFLTESGGNNSEPPTVARDWNIVPQMYSEELLYNNLSGQIAYDFFEEGNNFGLYKEQPLPGSGAASSGTLTPTEFGGAANLSAKFGEVVSTIPPMPGSVTTPSACPTECNPPLVGSLIPNTNITIQNFADSPLVAVQGQGVIANLPASINSSTPSSVTVKLSNQRTLYILDEANNWGLVCKVSPNNITEGMTVMNNVQWGGSCNTKS